MRVLLVSNRFPPDGLGGVERYCQALAVELRRRGDDVAIVARRPGGGASLKMLRECLPDGTLLYRLTGGAIGATHDPAHYQDVERFFSSITVEFAPEVVHVNHLLGFSPRIVAIAQRLRLAIVISLHDFYFACARVHLQRVDGMLCGGPDGGGECALHCFPGKWVVEETRWGLRTMQFQQVLRSAQAIIAYSQFVADYFQPLLPASLPVQVFPNGVPRNFAGYSDWVESSSRQFFTIAYCGTIAPHKGPHVILQALRVARLPAVRLLLFGHIPDAAYRSSLRRMAEEISGLRMQMVGRYERKQLPVLLVGVDCVIVPSLVWEAGPIAPRESLALGTPILVSRLGALPELVEEGVNGFTFDPERPDELATLLIKLSNDDDLRRRLRAGAANSQMPTIEEHVGRVRSVYEDAVRGSLDFTRPQSDGVTLDVVGNAMQLFGSNGELRQVER
jgi:glycosyltransferase involved in cell wall biosynthesis